MTDPFADPGSSTSVDWSQHVGELLMLTVHGVEREVATVHGVTDAIRADVVVLDGAHRGEEYADTLVFPKLLQSQLRSRIGQKVLGRLGQGEAKRGQSAPWQLNAATDQDKQTGRAYLSQQMSSPAPAQQQSAPQQQQSFAPQGEPPF
jgi:hypothetical protein